MSQIDKTYLQGLSSIMGEGYLYEDPNRKGVYRKEIPKFELRHELSEGFPIINLKQSYFKGAVAELLFFLSGSTDIRDLWRRGVRFWDKDWARFKDFDEYRAKVVKDEWVNDGYASGGVNDFSMGKIYPYQYRSFNGRIDQIKKAVDTLRYNPMSTSNIVNAWNPDDLDEMALPPCHYGFQIIGIPLGMGKYGFEIHWQQRSTDYFLGTPVNVQYYALMAHLFGELTGHKPLAIQGDLKNVHLYDNQWEQSNILLGRDPEKFDNTTLIINLKLSNINKLPLDEYLKHIEVQDFGLFDYESYDKLSAEMLTKDK